MKKKLPAEKDGERRPETKDDSGIKGCGGEGGREVVSDGGASSGGGVCTRPELAWDRGKTEREREKERDGILEDLGGGFVLKPVRHIVTKYSDVQESTQIQFVGWNLLFLTPGIWIRTAFGELDTQLTSPFFPSSFSFFSLLPLQLPPNMFFFQLVIMSGTVLLAYYMECTDLFSVHVQGFFCNDADLMKPYPGTEESSFVPPLILYCVVAAAPTAIVSKQQCLKPGLLCGLLELFYDFLVNSRR